MDTVKSDDMDNQGGWNHVLNVITIACVCVYVLTYVGDFVYVID